MYLKSKYLYEVVPSHASQYQSTLSTHISWAFKNPDSANIAKNQIYLAQHFGPKMSSGTQEGMSAFLSKYWKGWHVSSSKSHCQFPFFLAHWRLLCHWYLFLPAQVLVTLKHQQTFYPFVRSSQPSPFHQQMESLSHITAETSYSYY